MGKHDMKPGIMIAFDGVNGAGKSTILKKIAAHLKSLGLSVLVTREPGGTPIGESIRGILLDPNSSAMTDMAEVLLLTAARAQHVEEKIIPALERGYVVLCDRYLASTISFQHHAKGIDLKLIEQVSDIALKGFKPSAYFLFDLSVEEGARRVSVRNEALERFELMDLEFHQRVREGYLRQHEQNPEDFILVDASRAEQVVYMDVRNQVEALLKSYNLLSSFPVDEEMTAVMH